MRPWRLTVTHKMTRLALPRTRASVCGITVSEEGILESFWFEIPVLQKQEGRRFAGSLVFRTCSALTTWLK